MVYYWYFELVSFSTGLGTGPADPAVAGPIIISTFVNVK